MNVSTPQGIYYKNIGCTVYPSIYDFPTSMHKTLQNACAEISTNLTKVGLSYEKKNQDYKKILRDIDQALALHGVQLLNMHNTTTLDPLKNNEPGHSALQCMITQIRIVASVKQAIELGADVNGTTNGTTLLCGMLPVKKTTPLWMAITIAKVYNKEKNCFDIALYLRSRGGIMYSSVYRADESQNLVLKKIDEILLKTLCILTGHCDTSSSLSLLPKEVIFYISRLFKDCIRKDIQ